MPFLMILFLINKNYILRDIYLYRSKLELWRIEVKRHFGPKNDLFSWAADNERQHFFRVRFEFYL